MLTVDQIKEQLKDRNLRAVARAVKLHENTIYRFINNRDPRWSTVEKLSKYLEEQNNNE